MKTIIDGKRYDTDAAQTVEVASASSGCGGDFSSYSESLYRTGRGHWFVAGSGGPASHYAVSCGNQSWSGGAKITPLTANAAQKWLESNDESQALETWFSASIEDA